MTGSCPVSARVCRETARERDEARAEVERLRAGLDDLARMGEQDGRGNSLALARRLRELLAEEPHPTPTEGDRDD